MNINSKVDALLEAHAAAAIAAHEHGDTAGYYHDLRKAEKAIRDAIGGQVSETLDHEQQTAAQFGTLITFGECAAMGCGKEVGKYMQYCPEHKK